MSNRSRAREVALQLLFQRDQNKILVRRRDLLTFARERLKNADAIDFCMNLYDGVLEHLSTIDKLLTETAQNWRLMRMMPADRNVLRIGTYELLHNPEQTPIAVVINEAIELARRFGSEDSSGFVNGILDKVAKGREEPTTTSPTATS
ncbi:MAG: transcription antitermination factor NusB [Bacteroidales bacterium]|nr:transcription antitermination factor NusB [Bacteroidales bacterium]